MSEFLKGNFKVKRDVIKAEETEKGGAEKLSEEFRKKAMSSLGGSMVYVDRTEFTWDGEDDSSKKP